MIYVIGMIYELGQSSLCMPKAKLYVKQGE